MVSWLDGERRFPCSALSITSFPLSDDCIVEPSTIFASVGLPNARRRAIVIWIGLACIMNKLLSAKRTGVEMNGAPE